MGKDPDRARIVIDLQAAQTESSRHRGVGRYSLAFTQALARARGKRDIRIVANEAYGDSISTIDAAMEGLLPTKTHISHYTYPPVNKRLWTPGDLERAIGSHLINHRYARLQPDILHLSHVFEGYSGNAIVPAQLPEIPGVIISATLYDLIPLRFRNIYLADPNVERWYHEKLGLLKQCDLLLAISESTRQDAIELLGIAPKKIVTIFGACEEHFKKIDYPADARTKFLTRYGIRERYVLYTGGDDHRKNLLGALAGYAALPEALRRSCQFVIVCAMEPERREFYIQQARRLGLQDREVIITGFVPDTDLVTFYNLCNAFIFPSLYEGFGLPVLEAMACGAPVIVSNNSSIREIFGLPNAWFDPADPESISLKLAEVLTDESYANSLRDYGIKRAQDHSWAGTAALALDAYDEAYSRANADESISVAANLPLKKLAYFSPLPPCRSGIADYNATFLPYLTKYFEIDLFIDDYEISDPWLLANCAVFSYRDYPRLHQDYETTIYEFGNSEFHVHMLDLLIDYPGIVGLHDAYLSGLIGYIDFNCRRSGYFLNEMLHSHGPRAQHWLAPVREATDPVGEAVRQLPCTRRILEQAIGIIAHSPFNLEVCEEFYPEGWRPPFRIIKQLVKLPAPVGAVERLEIRRALGLDDGDFVVGAFGHIAWTKAGDLLLQAFEEFLTAGHPNSKLIFVGELAKDHFGEALSAAAIRDFLKEKVRITGYLNEADYQRYLLSADAAVQLRKFSRGGTPKGVLDCLAYGVPVIINDYASYNDYPEGVAFKLSADPTVLEIADAISACFSDVELRSRLATAGRNYIAEEHNPELIAAQYARTIHEYVGREKASSRAGLIRRISSVLRNTDSARDEPYLRAVASAAARTETSFRPQRLLIDVSHITEFDHQAGIQRVVRNIVRELYCSERNGFSPMAVKLDKGELTEPTKWIKSQGLLVNDGRAGSVKGTEGPVVPARGDIFLLLDYSLSTIELLEPVIDQVRTCSGSIYAVVYDILPIQHPKLIVAGGSEWFKAAFERLVGLCDGLVCISKAVADDVLDYLSNHTHKRTRPLRIGWWHLGADTPRPTNQAQPRSVVEAAFAKKPFLMVGTVEPRKGHAFAIDAFDLLWADGVDASLCIVGKPGWMYEDVLMRLRKHSQYGRLLHYVESPTDDELNFAYGGARALLFPSIGEGFGLPIIEAARLGLPVIASDIPVFREIGQQHITYFARERPELLARTIRDWIAKPESELPDISKLEISSWEQSAQALLSVVMDNNWYKVLPSSNP